jgi:hypothetical protein
MADQPVMAVAEHESKFQPRAHWHWLPLQFWPDGQAPLLGPQLTVLQPLDTEPQARPEHALLFGTHVQAPVLVLHEKPDWQPPL